MKRLKKVVAVALALLFLLPPSVAFASVSLHVEADSNRVQAGDVVVVTISVSGKGLAIVEGSFTYDPAVLSYSEGEGGASDGFINMVSLHKGGTDILKATIQFLAVGEGNADIQVSIEKALGYDGGQQEGAKSSASIAVSAPQPTPAPTPLDYAVKGVMAQNVKNASENMYIWRTLENVTVPSRYSETTLTYHGETVAAAIAEDSNAPKLLYLSNAAGNAGGYYIFNAEEDTLFPYQTISSVSKTYILLEPPGDVPLPEGFFETTLTIGERKYAAWQSQDAQPVYLLYARNPSGETGYFVYHEEDESMQRYAVMPAPPVLPSLDPETEGIPVPGQADTAPAQKETSQITLSSTVLYAMCGGAALLFICVIGLLILRSVEKAQRRRRAAQRRAEREQAQQRGIVQ